MTLRKGSKGDEVKALQEDLNKIGFPVGRADGLFGGKTKQGVVDFQSAYLVDGIADVVTLDAIEKAVKAHDEKGRKILLPVPHGFGEIQGTFGVIEFVDTAGGSIRILNNWADEHIVKVNLPVVGTHWIHKKMEPVFKAVFQNIKDKGLDDYISQVGFWSPRHKMHDPKRPLSTHSWAISTDINWATNPVGAVGDMPPGIVESFEAYGFQWGGRWGTRDDMHFQYATGH